MFHVWRQLRSNIALDHRAILQMRNYNSTTVLLMAIPELSNIAPKHYDDILDQTRQDRSAVPWSRYTALAIGGGAVYFWYFFVEAQQLHEQGFWLSLFINMAIFFLLDLVIEFCLLRMIRSQVVAQLSAQGQI